MATLGEHPPQGDALAHMGSLGIRMTMAPTVAFDGHEPVGPEAAGAVLILQNTLADEEKAQQFWGRNGIVLEKALEAPGLIRFMAFSDGLCHYAIAFWRSMEDAQAFARGAEHRDARKELYATGNQYTHFAGLYSAASVSPRHIFCERCGTANTAPVDKCTKCGNELVDVFKEMVRPVPAQERG